MDWTELIGKKVVALRGWERDNMSRGIHCLLSHVLFDDGETFIYFSEQDPQDPYAYRDCCPSARIVELIKDKIKWREMFDQVGHWGEPDDSTYPF